jgi:HEAT repeat protein
MSTSLQKEASSSRHQLASRKLVAWLIVLGAGTAAVAFWHLGGHSNSHSGDRAACIATGNASAPGEPATVPTTSTGAKASDREEFIAEITHRLDAEWKSNEGRRRAALMLASDGSEAAMRALKEVLGSADTEVQKMIAEALGHCTNAESGAILRDLLKSPNDSVARAAVRSLSQQASSSAVASLVELIYDKERAVDVRAEAAQGLGAIARPEALAALVAAAVQINDEGVATEIVRGIAGRPFDETSAFLQTFLDAPDVSAELKAEALESLGQAKGDPTGLLLKYAKNADDDLRAAAARALGSLEAGRNSGVEIMAWLNEEGDPLVRKRLYKALANQESFDINAAWLQTASERDPAARIAGLDLLAKAVQRDPSEEMISFFDERALPDLRGAALNGATKDERMAAITALRRLNTPNALAALQEIAAQTRDAQLAGAATVRRSGDVPR